MTAWYQIKVNNVQLSSKQTFMYCTQLENDELCISPHVKLAGSSKEAHIDNIKLAKDFLDKCLPIFQKRYGNEALLTIIKCSSAQNNSLSQRIYQDTEIIRARLKTNNFTPNKKVYIYDV
jgi:hypothetical protein